MAVESRHASEPAVLDAAWLRELCLEHGADDVGFVSIDDPSMVDERPYALEVMPGTKTLIGMVRRTNRDNIRSRARSVGNAEIFNTGHDIDETNDAIVKELDALGIRAANPSTAFPMELPRYGAPRVWGLQHKTVAVAAGLGHMGIHRNVIHPRFGNFIILSTVLTEARVDEYSKPIDYNPCLGCNLCVAVCPVGAIKVDAEFDFLACYQHNYRQHMSGFREWVQRIAESDDGDDYPNHFGEAQTAAMYQNLASKPIDYLSGYCLSVCPAGEDVIGPFLHDRKQHVREIVKPLQQREEVIYVSEGSSAEAHLRKRFPHKRPSYVTNTPRLDFDLVETSPAPPAPEDAA
ncbi:MAG TPA: 4Fe-4S binding protein [Solirubrobacteraceae bacterium]